MSAIVPILGVVSDIIGRFIADPQKKAEAQLEVMKLQLAPDLAQISANTAQASNENLFVSGPRPAIMWICAIALGFAYIITPILGTFLPEARIPHFPIEEMINLVYALLGLGAMRSFDKMKGTTR